MKRRDFIKAAGFLLTFPSLFAQSLRTGAGVKSEKLLGRENFAWHLFLILRKLCLAPFSSKKLFSRLVAPTSLNGSILSGTPGCRSMLVDYASSTWPAP
jgi:hypothetical protein